MNPVSEPGGKSTEVFYIQAQQITHAQSGSLQQQVHLLQANDPLPPKSSTSGFRHGNINTSPTNTWTYPSIYWSSVPDPTVNI